MRESQQMIEIVKKQINDELRVKSINMSMNNYI